MRVAETRTRTLKRSMVATVLNTPGTVARLERSRASPMDEGPAYHLDIAGLRESGDESAERDRTWLFGRPWLGVHFDCCGLYTRVYRNLEGTAYVGRCPRCQRPVRFRVGSGGTRARFFEAW